MKLETLLFELRKEKATTILTGNVPALTTNELDAILRHLKSKVKLIKALATIANGKLSGYDAGMHLMDALDIADKALTHEHQLDKT